GRPGLDQHDDDIASLDLGGIAGDIEPGTGDLAVALGELQPVVTDRVEVVRGTAVQQDALELRGGAGLARMRAHRQRQARGQQRSHGSGSDNGDLHDGLSRISPTRPELHRRPGPASLHSYAYCRTAGRQMPDPALILRAPLREKKSITVVTLAARSSNGSRFWIAPTPSRARRRSRGIGRQAIRR